MTTVHRPAQEFLFAQELTYKLQMEDFQTSAPSLRGLHIETQMDLIIIACGNYIILQVSYQVLDKQLLRVNLEVEMADETSMTAVSIWDIMKDETCWGKQPGTQDCSLLHLHRGSIFKR